MSLSSPVQSVQKLIKVIFGLAAEHVQQLLVLSDRCQFRSDDIAFFLGENTDCIKFTDKSGILGNQILQQKGVMWLDSRMHIVAVQV